MLFINQIIKKNCFKNQAHVEKEGNVYFKFLVSLMFIVPQTQYYSAQGNG